MQTRRKINERFIRKISKVANGTSYSITLPIEIIREWKWKEKQKVVLDIDKKNRVIKIKDWKK
jgi:hypothetical protein